MNDRNSYAGLNFRRTAPRISRRWIVTLATPVIFLVLCGVFSIGQLLFPMTLFLAALTWVATYGWDKAYA